MNDKIYSIGLKGLLLFGLLCASSVEAVYDRKSVIFSSLCRPFQDNITKVPTSSDNTSMIQKNGFKLVDEIDPSEYPDAFTDSDSMLFLAIFQIKIGVFS